MSLKGFDKGFTKSKVASHKVIKDSGNSGLGVGRFGKNNSKAMIGLKSNSKAAKGPTGR